MVLEGQMNVEKLKEGLKALADSKKDNAGWSIDERNGYLSAIIDVQLLVERLEKDNGG
jgi:hypothetical protein